jgi:hypothetical protein
MFFDLSDNEFEFPSEVKGMHTCLRQVTEHVHNMQAVVKVDLRNQGDSIGGCCGVAIYIAKNVIFVYNQMSYLQMLMGYNITRSLLLLT